MNGSQILWQVPSLNDHSLDPRDAIVLDLVPRASAHQADEARLLNFWKISFQARVIHVWTWIEEIWPEGSNLEEIVWQLPSLRGHSSGPRGPIDLNFSFSMARPLPGLGDGHRNWPKSPFLARVISVQSIPTKGVFWAFFMKRRHYVGFHCFCFHCQYFGHFLLKIKL